MDWDQLGAEATKAAQEILGYLNFSSGAEDPRFLANINELAGRLEKPRGRSRSRRAAATPPVWRQLETILIEATQRVRGTTDAFRDVEQARAVLELVFQHVLPGYRRHHRDLLFHQSDEALFVPFFLGRACEAVLAQGPPWDQTDRIVFGAISRLNDFIGHRPVAVLQNDRKLQPYDHEWVRPIPLFIRQAGVGVGPYHDLVAKALEILAATDRGLLAQAAFNPEWLDELALDPRAYDFDHPANKRPNHHFGQWDPHLIDNAGRYRRFVLQQVTLDAILEHVEEKSRRSKEEALFEAASVLAGTMLMASGISGSGPGVYDSSTTLTTLLPHIAAYRDAFYEQLLAQLEGPHGQRLRDEAVRLRQPFGGVRQRLNQQLAQRRARQLERAHLAQLYASMGYTEAALRQAEIVSVASARITCQIRCRLTMAHLAIDRRQLDEAAAALPEIEDLVHRGIQCGALPDPWNILGFGAQFSLFPAVENSVHDHRLDELIDLLAAVFGLYTRLQQAAVAAGDTELPGRLSTGMEALARWWDKYASSEVGDVDGFSGREMWESSVHVAEVLRAWFEAGTAAGDLAFWRGHLERFHSPKAYALVVKSLLDQHDLVAAMALLIQWLGQANDIPLVEQEHSFHELALEWMEALLESDSTEAGQRRVTAAQRWPLARKLLDYLEANADEYWRVPQLELAGRGAPRPPQPIDDEPDGDEEDEGPDALFAAAYEDVTFRDSAADGVEGEMLQGGHHETEFELLHEAERIADRLDFLTTLARLWRLAASALGATASDRDDVLSAWLATATANQAQLAQLMASVDRFEIPPPRASHEAMVEYDRRRGIKEQLLEQIIATSIETADAARSIRAAMERVEPADNVPAWEVPAQRVLWAAFRGDRDAIRQEFPQLLGALAPQPLLYVALAKGGGPQQIVTSRNIQRVLRRLLALLPRLGLLWETFRLLRTILDMERDHAVGPGAITEFDQMFEIGCRGIVRSLIAASEKWQGRPPRPATIERAADIELIGHLERAVEALLRIWLDHSRRVRLSVLETVTDDNRWRTLVRFIETYGRDLFTQKFMNLGNLRAILHRGAEAWLRYVEEEPDEEAPERLLADLDGPLPRDEAAGWLNVSIEAVIENYPEYIDYNSTTTQSDRGDMLYTLLDFLRLQASYQRVAWNLRPIVLAHEVLVRGERDQAAEIWRQAVQQRTAEIAEEHLQQFAKLSRQYGMRLPSIDQRLQERFIRPLTIDRLRALVPAAIDELRRGARTRAFAVLQAGIERLTQEPAGVGFDVPNWLQALEDEVDGLVPSDEDLETAALEPNPPVDEVRLTLEEVKRQIRRMLDED